MTNVLNALFGDALLWFLKLVRYVKKLFYKSMISNTIFSLFIILYKNICHKKFYISFKFIDSALLQLLNCYILNCNNAISISWGFKTNFVFLTLIFFYKIIS